MNQKFKPQGKFAIAIAAILIFGSAGLWFLPTWTLRWYAAAFEEKFEAHQLSLAKQLEPELSKTNAPEIHIPYQIYKMAAGEKQQLQRYYRYLVDAHPENPSLKYYLARILTSPEERNAILNAQSTSKDLPAAIAYSYEQLMEQGRYMEAHERLFLLPQSWLQFYWLAQTADRLNYIEFAQEAYEKSLEYKATPTYVRTDYARFLYHRQIKLAQDPFTDWTKDKLILYPSAYALQQILNQRDASDVFNHSPLPVICDVKALYILAEEALRQDEIVTARISLNRSNQIQPGQPEILALFGVLARKEERPEYAKRLMRTGLNADNYIFRDYSSDFHAAMGDVLLRWDETEFAYEHFLKAWIRPPDNPQMLLRHAKQYLQNEQPCEAAKWLERALKIEPTNTELKTLLARAANGCGQEDHALKLFYEILSKEPQNRSIVDQISRILVKRGEVGAAISLYYRRIQENPKDGSLYAAIGKIHIKNGNPEKAKSYLTQALKNHPDMKNKQAIQKLLKK